MNSAEYDNLARVEKIHWYYSGKRAIAKTWLNRSGKLTKASLLADCGAGTGAFAVEMTSDCQVIAVDDYPESLAILKDRLGQQSVRAGSCTSLPLESESCDFVTALDVLEHIDDDQAAIKELWRILKPGGTIVITVPALMSLWSDWDVSLRHFRRYDKRGLHNLLCPLPFEIVELNYMNFFAFPAVWLSRKLRAKTGGGETRAEDQLPPDWANSLLRSLFVWSSCQRLFAWPFGVGLLAVARKKITP